MYLRYVIDPIPRMLAERRAQDIVSRHIEARNKVVHLRRKLQVKDIMRRCHSLIKSIFPFDRIENDTNWFLIPFKHFAIGFRIGSIKPWNIGPCNILFKGIRRPFQE